MGAKMQNKSKVVVDGNKLNCFFYNVCHYNCSLLSGSINNNADLYLPHLTKANDLIFVTKLKNWQSYVYRVIVFLVKTLIFSKNFHLVIETNSYKVLP